MGGTSYSWTVMQEGPNDCMVDIIWTTYAYLWNKASYILASVCVLNYWRTDVIVEDRKEVIDTMNSLTIIY